MCTCCGGTFIAWALASAHAADEVVVPVTQEPRHRVRFENEYLRIIQAIFVPGDQSLFHKHAMDSIGIVGPQPTKVRVEVLNQPKAVIGTGSPGDTSYYGWHEKPLIHRVTNIDDARTAIFIVSEIIVPTPGQFPAPDRTAAPAYASVVDSARAQAWRLKLAPGESAPAIKQSGPGVRVVITGNQLRETAQGSPDRDLFVSPGYFEYQPAGRSRRLSTLAAHPSIWWSSR
jgi:hypothetical protein